MKTYKEFTKEFMADCKAKGEKVNFKAMGEAWQKYKVVKNPEPLKPNKPKKPEPVKPDKPQIEPKPKEPETMPEKVENMQNEPVVMEQQPDAPILATPETTPEPVVETLPTTPPPAVVEKKAENIQGFSTLAYRDRHKMVARAVHKMGANLIDISTDGEITIDDDDMNDLNECGADLLSKYDKNGKIAENAPEVAYLLTIGGIATQIYALRKIKQKQLEQQKATGTEKAQISPNVPMAK